MYKSTLRFSQKLTQSLNPQDVKKAKRIKKGVKVKGTGKRKPKTKMSRKKAASVIAYLTPGSNVYGEVHRITRHGAVIKLFDPHDVTCRKYWGGVTGFLHISEIADKYISNLKDHLEIGQKFFLIVLTSELDEKRGISIKLSKKLTGKPFRSTQHL
jgi:predicted RNA-binding protein with RPS1 domain